jgi:hypothetical protein
VAIHFVDCHSVFPDSPTQGNAAVISNRHSHSFEPRAPGGLIVNLAAISYQVSLPSKITIHVGKTKGAFTIKALNVGAAQTFHVYAHAAGQGVRTTLTALP